MHPLGVDLILHCATVLDQEVLRFVVALSAYHAADVVNLRPETECFEFGQVLLALGAFYESFHLIHPPHSTLIQFFSVVLVITLPSP